MKKKKIGAALFPSELVLGIFLFYARLGTGTSYACAMVILMHFTNLAAQDAAKQRMTKLISSTKVP